MDTIEGNKLIAEFMGVNYYESEPCMKVWLNDNDGTLFYCEWHPNYSRGTDRLAWTFAPEKNWCQLMPVVEKIESLGYAFKSCRRRVEIWKDPNPLNEPAVVRFVKEETKIQSHWQAIIQFIQWYNQQKQNNEMD